MDALDPQTFQPATLDKVNRLLDILEEIQIHPALKGKLAMHGGTAINLFMLDLPRLSVDIDISYIGAFEREKMQAERPIIEKALQEVGSYLGYEVRPGEGGHAGRTFVLRYKGLWGADHVKIDCIYMNRSPLLPVKSRECALRPGLGVTMFDDLELAGGKVKAFFDRVKVRDLYDIGNIALRFESEKDTPRGNLAHKVMLYYASQSACFPNDFSDRPQRFANRQSELEEQLYPMLRLSAGKPSLEDLTAHADAFISDWIEPRSDAEQEYLERFAQGDYRPELLFEEPSMAAAAAMNPEALWKLQNLRKML